MSITWHLALMRSPVRVSFGGRQGPELAGNCSSAPDLARAYQSVVDRYRLSKVDFDLEGVAVAS